MGLLYVYMWGGREGGSSDGPYLKIRRILILGPSICRIGLICCMQYPDIRVRHLQNWVDLLHGSVVHNICLWAQ